MCVHPDAVAEEFGDGRTIHPWPLEEFRESSCRVFTESVIGVADRVVEGWFEGQALVVTRPLMPNLACQAS